MEVLWDRDADSGEARRGCAVPVVPALSSASIVVSVVSPFHGSAALVSLTEFAALSRENRARERLARSVDAAWGGRRCFRGAQGWAARTLPLINGGALFRAGRGGISSRRIRSICSDDSPAISPEEDWHCSPLGRIELLLLSS